MQLQAIETHVIVICLFRTQLWITNSYGIALKMTKVSKNPNEIRYVLNALYSSDAISSWFNCIWFNVHILYCCKTVIMSD